MAETTYSVRVVKTLPYRGTTQQWSNRYHFDGAAPANWPALFDAVVLEEKAAAPASVGFIACHGYAPGSERAVATKVYSEVGTLNAAGLSTTPGDCAAVLRMATTKLSVKNHVVYVFSYYHRALYTVAGGEADNLAVTQRNAIAAYADVWLNGLTVLGRVFKRTTPDGHATTGRAVDAFVGHRDFPR